jgi:hypothetical protein
MANVFTRIHLEVAGLSSEEIGVRRGKLQEKLGYNDKTGFTHFVELCVDCTISNKRAGDDVTCDCLIVCKLVVDCLPGISGATCNALRFACAVLANAKRVCLLLKMFPPWEMYLVVN